MLFPLTFWASGATYYVDATNGSDSNAGTLAAPWQTVAKVNATQQAGDTIRWKRDEAWTGTALQAQSGVRYLDYGSGAKPILSASGIANPIIATGKSGIHFANLDCRNGTTGSYFDGCSALVFVDCDMSSAGNDNLTFINGCNNVLVSGGAYNNAASGGGHAGIEITDGCFDIEIAGVTCDGNPIGITIHNHPLTTMPTDITVRDCTITNSSLNAFQISLDGTSNQTVSIEVERVEVDTSSGGHLFAITRVSTGYLNGSITLRDCVAHGSINGVYNYDIQADDVTLERCRSYHTGAATAERVLRILNSKRTKVYHGTFYRAANPGGIGLIFIDGARGDDIEVKNTIIASGATGLLPVEVTAAYVAAGGSLDIDYNLYQKTAATAAWKWNGTNRTFADWKTLTGTDAHSIAGSDPLFVDAGAFDFTLQAGSPAIDQGVVIAGVNDGYLGAAPDLGYAEKA
jgi:hypothetical protein